METTRASGKGRRRRRFLMSVTAVLAMASIGTTAYTFALFTSSAANGANAFATGIDPRSASIAVTEGLLRTLNREELQGVVAHEMSHVQNFDTRLMTLLAGMVGAIALMSDGLGRMLRGGVRIGAGRGACHQRGGFRLLAQAFRAR